MTGTNQNVRAVQQTRRRAMIVPREHGAWGLLLVPLFTGVVAGFSPEHRVWALFLFTTAALSLFALRTPLESLLGTSAISARTSGECWTALIASTTFGLLALACLSMLIWNWHYSALLLLGAVGACAFVMQAVLRRLGRHTRMISQVVGAIALTSTAPAAYYVGTGRLDTRALLLWIANWIFAGDQIHFVQLRIHTARAASCREKLARGRAFLGAQLLLLIALVMASLGHILPTYAILAFVPALVRGSRWFFQKPEPLDVKRLGWSEMKQGVAFGVLLAVAFLAC
ncbi:MAG TPA: YwiC-like family protein [Terriglobales bacterium]|nr:YwiC-like family protein [Terriglobales bacterium]